MMKFFRKHTKYMLAVFMSLLLVVWLGGSALQSSFVPDTGAEVQATAFGLEITRRDVGRFANETRLLANLRRPNMPWDLWSELRFAGAMGSGELLEPIDWFLLRQEADNMGIVVTDAQVDKFLKPMTDDDLQTIRNAGGRNISVAAIREVIRSFIKVSEAAALLAGTG